MVTGLSSGIGEATAQILNNAGATIIGLDLMAPQVACDQFIQMDQGNYESIDAAIAQVDRKVDGICNIAGVPPTDKLSLNQILMINFFGLQRFTLGLDNQLNDGASIVNIASGAGAGWMRNLDLNRKYLALESEAEIDAAIVEDGLHNKGIDSRAVYPFSKELVITWTMKHSKDRVAQGIRMNAVSPGATQTAILDDFIENFGEVVAERTAAFGFGQPDQIADVITWLLTPASRWVNGANIPVDGGILAAAMSKSMLL